MGTIARAGQSDEQIDRFDRATLDRLAAESAIRFLISTYCDCVARRDAAGAALLFASDAHVQIADLPARNGSAEILAGVGNTFANFSFLSQICDVGLISIETQSKARARLNVVEFNQRQGEDNLTAIVGVYEDEYSRCSEAWLFQNRRFTLRARTVLEPAEFERLADLGDPFRPPAV